MQPPQGVPIAREKRDLHINKIHYTIPKGDRHGQAQDYVVRLQTKVDWGKSTRQTNTDR